MEVNFHYEIVLKTNSGLLSVNHVSSNFFCEFSRPAQVSVLILFLAGKRCMQSYTSLENWDKNWPRPNVTEILDPQPFLLQYSREQTEPIHHFLLRLQF